MTTNVSPELMRKAALRQAQERAARDGVRCLVWSHEGTWYVRTDAEGEVEGAKLEWVEPAPNLGGFVLLAPPVGHYRTPQGPLAGIDGLNRAIVFATRDEALQAAQGREVVLHTSRQPTPELVAARAKWSGPRANAVADCPKAGQLGHRWCGICPVHNVPRSECGDNGTTSMGDPLSKLADGMELDDAHAGGGQ